MGEAVRAWAHKEGRRDPELLRLGWFGSYARGDWGVGSDLDLIAIVSDSASAFHRRLQEWEVEALPVPADLLVYTKSEWERIAASNTLFARTVQRETVWIFP